MEARRYAEREDRAWVRSLLMRWGNVRALCEQLNTELENLTKLRQHMAKFSGEKAQSGQDVQKELEVNICRIAESCKAELRFSRSFEKWLIALNGSERRVLYLRYWGNCTYLQVANRMNKSVDQVKRVEGLAVDKLNKMLRG